MQASDDFAEKYGIGHIVAPCVMDEVIDSTMPKQWNIGTWIIILSRGLTRHQVVPCHGLVEGQAAFLAEPDGDDVAEERQARAVQGLPRLAAGDLRAEFVDDLAVVGVQRPVDHHQRMRIGLAEQVLRLVRLVCGVHRDQYRADADRGPESDVPCGNVGSPDGDLVAGLDAQGHERTGEIVHVLAELLVRAGIVQRGVLEAVLVRELVRHAVEHLRECQVDELVLLPDIESRTVVVRVELGLLVTRAFETLHIVDEMREDDLPVGQVFHPFRLPLERDEAVVVDGREGVHDFPDGEITLADDSICAGLVAVTEMHVLDIGPKVGDGVGRAFAEVAVRMMNVPKGRQLVAGEVVHQVAQQRGIGIYAAGLDQDGDAALLRHGDEAGEVTADDFRRIGLGEGADIRRAHVGSEPDERLHILEHRLVLFG